MSTFLRTKYKVSLFQALVLLHNLLTSEEGHNDANRTKDQLVKELNRRHISLDKDILESLLYCSNMNQEQGKWWHPSNLSFDRFVKNLLPIRHNFNLIYNLIMFDSPNNND